jgi:hypothetical protein
MWIHRFQLTAAIIALAAFASQAAEKPRPAQGNQNQNKKVWTNEDVDQLRSRGLISIVGQETSEGAAPATSAESAAAQPTGPVYESRLDDPRWYADVAADLHAQLDKHAADLQQQQEALAMAKDRVTQPGLSLKQDNAGVTPAAGIENLQAQVAETQAMLDELADLARVHNIPPGALRG